MHGEWIVSEHHRLHIIEEWPEGPGKAAALAAIRSKLESLSRSLIPGKAIPDCEVCRSRKKMKAVIGIHQVARVGVGLAEAAA